MNLLIERIDFEEKYTIGKLYVNNKYICDTLEDAVRDFGENGEGKIPGETAIPYGEYKITIEYWPKYNIYTPVLHNVKYFTGIRIHSLNNANQTSGCIGVGKYTENGIITNSWASFEILMKLLENEKEHSITIINKFKT